MGRVQAEGEGIKRGEWNRKSPEELLREAEAEEARARRGYLKIFLGYASGVGKSFRMLDEARRRRERGQDVVVGAVQPVVPPNVEFVLKQLEVIPLKAVGGGWAMDLEAILRRKPAVCVVDGLAYDNPPGVRNRTRWQDVQDLLQAGIKVLTSVNIQFVAELGEQIEAITKKRPAETVPMAFIKSADEIEIVDAPEAELALLATEAGGEAEERVQRLGKLRELALVLAADVVDYQLQSYLERHGIRPEFGANERILVCITPRANLEEMLAAAKQAAESFHGELIVAYVRQRHISAEDEAALQRRLTEAAAAGARVEILEGDDPAETLLEFARSQGVTQLFVGHSQRRGLARLLPGPLDKLIWEAHGIDVRVFPQTE